MGDPTNFDPDDTGTRVAACMRASAWGRQWGCSTRRAVERLKALEIEGRARVVRFSAEAYCWQVEEVSDG